MNAKKFFEAMRFVRSRTNAPDFMAWFFPNAPFDDYHMRKWEMFRDDPIGFWCHSDSTIQGTLQRSMEALIREGKV